MHLFVIILLILVGLNGSKSKYGKKRAWFENPEMSRFTFPLTCILPVETSFVVVEVSVNVLLGSNFLTDA